MGVSDPGMMLTFLDHLSEVRTATNQTATGIATLGTGFKTATADAADQIKLYHQSIDGLFDSMVSPVLPWFNEKIAEMTSVVQGATSASEKHSTVVGDSVIAMTALGYGGSAAVTALSTLGMATIGFGNGMEAVGAVLKFMPTLFTGIGTAIEVVGAAISWPVVLIGASVAGLAYAGYQVYEHWGHLGEWFSGMWGSIKSVASSFGSWIAGWATTLGKTILIGIAGPFGLIEYEMYSHWDSIKAACEKIGSGIADFFVGHSPPPIGPLHELGRITIAETIADRIRPAPVLAAIRRTAAAAAIASTTMAAAAIGAGAGPVMAGGGGIVINAPITINAGPGADTAALERIVVAAFKRHRYELVRAIDGERERRERTVLS